MLALQIVTVVVSSMFVLGCMFSIANTRWNNTPVEEILTIIFAVLVIITTALSM